MASNYTENYGLCQWETTDQVLRTEFNEDNAKMDATLKELADKDRELEETVSSHTAAISKLGNCNIVYGSYTGNGTYGQSNPNSLVFEGTPIAVLVAPIDATGGSSQNMMLLRGAKVAYSMPDQVSASNAVIWGEKDVSWYAYVNSAQFQLNQGGTMYGYVALLTSA